MLVNSKLILKLLTFIFYLYKNNLCIVYDTIILYIDADSKYYIALFNFMYVDTFDPGWSIMYLLIL